MSVVFFLSAPTDSRKQCSEVVKGVNLESHLSPVPSVVLSKQFELREA